MNILIDVLKATVRFVFGLIAPFLVIFVGALLTGWAIHNEYEVLTWAGLVIIGAGVFWGLVLYFYYVVP